MRDSKELVALVTRMLLAMQRHSWEQGVAMQAFLENGEDDLVIAMAREAVYRSVPDGRVAVVMATEALTDPCSTGAALLHAIRLTGDPRLQAGYDSLLKWALEGAPRSAQGICYHLPGRTELWVDSMYMLPPFLAVAGHGDEAMHQWNGYYSALHNPETGLMSHVFDTQRNAFVRKDHWGGGNGWVLASAAQLFALLPDRREEIVPRTVHLADSVLSWMRPDGMFHDVIDDPSSFVEGNLSQMLAYTLYRGMTDGWLAPEKYEQKAEKLYHAAVGNVDEIGQIWQVCGAPQFDQPGTSPEAQAFFLLMTSARDRYHAAPKNLEG